MSASSRRRPAATFAGLLGRPVDSARRRGSTFFKRQPEAPKHAPDGEDGDGYAEPFADFAGREIGMLGDELANAIGLCRESGLRSPTTAGWGQRSRLTVALQESAHERRADSESFRHFGSGFASLTSLEDADAEIVGNRCHAAVRGMSSGLPGTSVYHPLPKCEVGSNSWGGC